MTSYQPGNPDEQVAALAAALRRDSQDIALYAGFLLNELSLALPEDMVEIERHKSMKDRLSGGDGEIVGITVALGDNAFTLERKAVGAKPEASVCHQVNGIKLSTTKLTVDAWAQQVSAALVQLAQTSSSAAQALEVMMKPRGL